MQKWEYCRLDLLGQFGGRFYRLNAGGTQMHVVTRDKSRGEKSESDAVERLIAELGADGWEMTGIAGTDVENECSIYFKRPLSS